MDIEGDELSQKWHEWPTSSRGFKYNLWTNERVQLRTLLQSGGDGTRHKWTISSTLLSCRTLMWYYGRSVYHPLVSAPSCSYQAWLRIIISDFPWIHPIFDIPHGMKGLDWTHVLLSLPIKDYTLRSGFFIPSELSDSYFAIVINNCGVFTQIGRTPNMTSIPFKVETTP